MKQRLFYIVLCSLLCLLSITAEGQTSASYQQADSRYPVVLQKAESGWGEMLWNGGMRRSEKGDWYLSMPLGASDFLVMNYVDGYSLGPHAIVGHMTGNRSRWELEGTARYAISRNALLSKGVIRWYSPVELGRVVEIYGGQHTENFDPSPSDPTLLTLVGSGILGWNYTKFIERTNAGMRVTMPLSNDLTLKANAGWERRRGMENHLHSNIFGSHKETNTPYIGCGTNQTKAYDGPIDGELALMGLQLDYLPGSRRTVYDDMTCKTTSRYPLISLKANVGMGDWHYLTLALHVSQDISMSGGQDHLRYHVSGGNTFKNGDLGLADWHHFDATRSWWQSGKVPTHFTMIDTYEYSTQDWWGEGHVEWNSGQMALTRLTRNAELMKEYIQMHAVTVSSLPMHWELHYGIELINTLRFGVAFGWDEFDYRGATFTMTLFVNNVKSIWSH